MSTEYRIVYTAAGLLNGEMIRGFLQAQGIPVVISQESVGVTYGLTVGSLGAVEIFVPEDRLQEAQDLLAQMDSGQIEPVPSDTGESGIAADENEPDEASEG